MGLFTNNRNTAIENKKLQETILALEKKLLFSSRENEYINRSLSDAKREITRYKILCEYPMPTLLLSDTLQECIEHNIIPEKPLPILPLSPFPFVENWNLTNEDEEKILSILKTDRRSAGFILKNKNLCSRILKEKPVTVAEFCSKYNYSKYSIFQLIDNNIISSFSNSTEKGRKVYIFENELLIYNNSQSGNNYSPLPVIMEAINLYLFIAKKTLTEREFWLLHNYFSGKSTLEQGYEFDLTSTRILILITKALKKLRNIIESMYDIDQVKLEYQNLSDRFKELQTKYERLPYSSKDTLHKVENLDNIFLDTSFFQKEKLDGRLLNIFNYNNIFCINDLLQYSLSDIKRFSGLGSTSISKLMDFCEKHNIILIQKK